MSAMDEINKKEISDMSTIENAIWRLWTFGGQTFIAEDAAAELLQLRAESEARRVALEQKSEECRREWTRAENAEAALEEAIRYVKAHPSEDNWDEDFLQKYGGQK